MKIRSGSPVAEVTGEPGEILIWSSGRSAVRLELGGDPEAVAALQKAGFTIEPQPES